MSFMKFGILTFLFLILGMDEVFAQTPPINNPKCIQGDPNNRSLHDFVTKINENNPFLLGWQQEQAFQNSAHQKLRKKMNSCSPHANTNWVELKSKIAPTRISTECIDASLQREPNNKGSLCENELSSKRQSLGRANENGPCITPEVRDYLVWSTNAAIDCMSTDENPLDPRFIFMLINNESAFHFYQQYNSGKGLGQLTTVAVKEILEHKKEFLEPILKSPKKSCQAFQSVVQKTLELENKKGTPDALFDANDNMRICPFIQPSEGLARSQIFTIAKFQRSYQKSLALVQKHLKGRHPQIQHNLAGLMALDFYGPENKVNNIETMREIKNMDQASTIAHLKKKSDYIFQTTLKMNEVIKITDKTPTVGTQLGQTCVE